MPNVIVKYKIGTPTTVAGSSVSIVAIAGGAYRHEDREVESMAFALGTGRTATIKVTSAAAGMPKQTCLAELSSPAAVPLSVDWAMQTGAGVLSLTIPDNASGVYFARLGIVDGKLAEITVKH